MKSVLDERGQTGFTKGISLSTDWESKDSYIIGRFHQKGCKNVRQIQLPGEDFMTSPKS